MSLIIDVCQMWFCASAIASWGPLFRMERSDTDPKIKGLVKWLKMIIFSCAEGSADRCKPLSFNVAFLLFISGFH